MTGLKLPLSLEQFHQLPRNAAYKYEYHRDGAFLSPRPKYYHALLDLAPLAEAPLEGACPNVVLRPLCDADWEPLVHLFAAAFRGVQPFGCLDDDRLREAARNSLEFTRNGGDGPWIPAASRVAATPDADQLLGATFVTLLPDEDPSEWHSFHWRTPPPEDAVACGLGRPHLTWIFVDPLHNGRGVGTALLNAVARDLLAIGVPRSGSS